MSLDLTRFGRTSRYDLENAMNKNLKDLRFINRLLKRLEAMDLNEESKDYLDRNKKVLRSNLKMANKSVNDLNPQYTRRRGGLSNQYGSSYSSNYSSYDSSDDFGWLWWVGGAIIFLVALNS